MTEDIFGLRPIGSVCGERANPIDDHWDAIASHVELDSDQFAPNALAGLDAFSHVEIIYLFHRVGEETVVSGARHPRGREDWPAVGIFAQRGKGRPNRLGATICRLKHVEGLKVYIEGLDAIDGTPVLDIKPVMSGFLPRGPFAEPDWAREILEDYWA